MPKDLFPLRRQLKEGTVPPRALEERPELARMPQDLLEDHHADMAGLIRGIQVDATVRDMAGVRRIKGALAQGDKGGDQRSVPASKPRSPPADEGYIRLVVHVENGEATVTSSRRVEGPLVATEEATGGYVWEVIVDGERVAADALGDVSEWRSFPDPKARRNDPRRGHHVTELEVFDFVARVPAGTLRAEVMGRAQIGVFRVKDASKPMRLQASRRPLAQDYAVQLREVARVRALDAKTIGKDAAARLRKVLPR